MEIIDDKVLMEQIRCGDNSSFKLLYTLYFPYTASYIKKNKGSDEDAEDIFQETIIVLLQKLKQPDFLLTSTLKTYLFAIAKNLWLKRLRDNKLLYVDDVAQLESYQADTEMIDTELAPKVPKEEQVLTWLKRITITCQQILKAIFYYNEPMESLMARLGWKNKHTAANQKYKCIEQVKKQKNKSA